MSLTSYPAALDDTSGDIPDTGANSDAFLGSASPAGTHPEHHQLLASAIEAVEERLGTDASETAPTAGSMLLGSGAGASGWYPMRVKVINSTGADQIAEFEAATLAGYTLYLPDEQYLLSREWHIDVSNFWVVGQGSGTPGTHGGTTIKRITNVGDAVVRWGAPDDTTFPLADFPMWGGGMARLTLNGNGAAAYGLQIKTATNARFDDLRIIGPATTGLHTWLLENDGDADQLNANTGLRFEQLNIRVTGAANGIVIDGGTPNFNFGESTYGCTWDGLYVSYATGVGLQINDADDLWFQNYFFVNSSTAQTAIELNGSNGGGIASNCHFFGGFPLTGTQKVIARGGNFARPSRGNTFFGLGTVDTRKQIDVEDGANVHFINGDGRSSMVPDERSTFIERDDFDRGGSTSGAVGAWGWDILAGTAARVASEDGRPGILRVDTGSVSGTVGGIGLGVAGGVGGYLMADNFWFTFVVRLTQTDADTLVRIGLFKPGQENASQPTDGIYFEKLGSDTNWFGVCRKNGTEARSDTTFAASTSFVKLQMRKRTIADIGFAVGDILNGFETGDVVTTTAPTIAMNLALQIRTDASSSKTMDVDLVQSHITGMDR